MRTEAKPIEYTRKGSVLVAQFTDAFLNFYVSYGLGLSLTERLARELDDGITALVLDLSDVKVVDSTGVSILIRANSDVSMATGNKARLCGLRPFIVKVLDILRVSSTVDIHETLEEALDSIPDKR